MRALVLTVALTLGAASASFAGSPTISKQLTSSPARGHWLSDGLNRLVFWQPQTSSNVKPKDLPDAR